MANAKAAKPTDNANEPVITIIKKAQTKSLEGKATLGYHLGLDETSALHCRGLWLVAEIHQPTTDLTV